MKIVQKVIAIALPLVAIAMAVYQLLYTQMLIQDPDGHLITHLGFAFAVAFLTLHQNTQKKNRWFLSLLLL